MNLFRTLVIALFLPAAVWAQADGFFDGPRVLAFADQPPTRVQVKVLRGTYKLEAYRGDSLRTFNYEKDEVHPTYTFDADLRLNKRAADSIRIVTRDTFVMRARLANGSWGLQRYYTGTLTLRNGLVHVEPIVKVSLNMYLAGVCEAEGGSSGEFAYHQAQAVLARTWLWANWDKHVEDGYNVKDDQSSQAFKGIPRGANYRVIHRAVYTTKDTVALHDGAPIIGFYHSNSGGQTVLPQGVWSQPLPYCRAVVDPFSIKGSKQRWSADISFATWKAYWEPLGISWTPQQWQAFADELTPNRLTHWTIGDKQFKLESLRRHLGLRSTYFTPTFDGEIVRLDGRGFGHGVGMSQQGAMRMARCQFSWREILDFYFQHLEYASAATL